jgi:hypothetical protein
MVLSLDAGKTFDKIQHSSMIKAEETRNRRRVPQHNIGYI